MKILVACEESQVVANAFREKGHRAWSCDILPCSGGHPEWHVRESVLLHLTDYWDLIIAFPPCTHLCVSGARFFAEKRRDGRQRQGIDFFMAVARAPCRRIAIENPVGIMSRVWRKPDQIIQPWQFGHPEQKATCLWLKGLPLLRPTDDVRELMLSLPKSQRERVHYLSGPFRAFYRSKTFSGIAHAMAEQWG